MIGAVGPIPGYFTLAGGGWTGLPGGDVTSAAGAPGNLSGRLLDGAGATLQALDNSQRGIARIKSELTKLRDTLQAARSQADAVPGRTALQPVVADIEQTRDKPTYVMVGGALVQTGTVTVPLGTRPVIVGCERTDRAPLAVGNAVKSLVSTVANLVATVGTNGNGGFAAAVSDLLKNSDFIRAVNTPDAAAIDAAIGRIDGVLAKAAGLGASLGARASSAAQVDLGGLLLAASNAGAGPSGQTGST